MKYVPNRPAIRTLDALTRDMTFELRLAIEALRAGNLEMAEMKVRSVLEYLTGSRE